MSQKFLQKRALAYTRRTLSGTSVPHLVVFLKYSDKICLIAFRPVWDVYYYTSRREGKPARANPARKIKFAEFAFSRAPIFWRNLRGEGGGVVVVVGGRLFKIVKFMSPAAGISKKIFLAQKCLKNTFFKFPSHEEKILSKSFSQRIWGTKRCAIIRGHFFKFVKIRCPEMLILSFSRARQAPSCEGARGSASASR